MVSFFGALGDSFQVNTTTAYDQERPAIAHLDDGGFLISWGTFDQDNSMGAIYAQRYDAAGAVVGGEFQVNTRLGLTQGRPQIATLNDGGFVITWQSNGPTGGNTRSYAQRYDADGATIGAEFRMPTVTLTGGVFPEITSLQDGGFLIVWTSLADGSLYGVYAQRYDAAGVTVGGPFLVNTYTVERQWLGTVAALNDGGFIITWRSQGQDGDGDGVYAQRYNGAGATVGSEFVVNTTTADDQQSPSVTALSDGGFVISWQSRNQEGSDLGIFAQRYNVAGTKTGGEFQVNTNTVGDQWSPFITALSDGGFIISWVEDGQGSDSGAYAQIYDANGVAQGTEFLVGTSTASFATQPAIASLNDGGFVITWVTLDQDGSGFGIQAQRYAAGGLAVLDGTAASETLDGTRFHEIINGLGGSDTLNGFGGNDILDGGLGSDTMIGGMGDDTYHLNHALDVVIEVAGEGFDRIISTVDLRLSPLKFLHIEALTLAGSATTAWGNSLGNELVGNDLDNILIGYGGDDTIIGNGGNDRLFGHSGDDYMAGGTGNDVFFVLQSGDVVVELAGEGIDEVRSGVNYTLGANLENLRLAGAATIGRGNELDNIMFGGREAAILNGFAGNDTIYGSNGDDTINGGIGDDKIYGRGGEDTVNGGSGNDTLVGEANADILNGDAGNDFIRGSNGHDILNGGSGNDTLKGEDNNDTLNGDSGADNLQGGGGFDKLTGGADRDVMTGGLQADDFIFDDGDFAGTGFGTADRIVDFSNAQGDDIDLSLVDAISGGGDDTFSFIGDSAFSSTAGELRYEQFASYTMVEMDVSGNGMVDYAIRLDGQLSLVVQDFILLAEAGFFRRRTGICGEAAQRCC